MRSRAEEAKILEAIVAGIPHVAEAVEDVPVEQLWQALEAADAEKIIRGSWPSLRIRASRAGDLMNPDKCRLSQTRPAKRSRIGIPTAIP
jgi:hypothetical protein